MLHKSDREDSLHIKQSSMFALKAEQEDLFSRRSHGGSDVTAAVNNRAEEPCKPSDSFCICRLLRNLKLLFSLAASEENPLLICGSLGATAGIFQRKSGLREEAELADSFAGLLLTIMHI